MALIGRQLLDPANTEPSKSSILDLFKDYQQTYPPITFPIPVAWLDLAFVTQAQLETGITAIEAEYPDLDRDEFRAFINDRARAVQTIAAYLAAYVDFSSDQAGDRIDELAKNTIAWHLADESTQVKLLEVFRTTARAVEANGDEALRALIRKSPLPPSDLLALRAWTLANIQTLNNAIAEGDLLNAVYAQVRQYVTSKALKKLSDQDQSVRFRSQICRSFNVRFCVGPIQKPPVASPPRCRFCSIDATGSLHCGIFRTETSTSGVSV